jgi:Protein of unknown function (DUF3489)
MSNTNNLIPLPIEIDSDPDADFSKLIIGSSRFAFNRRTGNITTVLHQAVPIADALSSVPSKRALAKQPRRSDSCDDRRARSQGERGEMKRFRVDAQHRIRVIDFDGENLDESDCFTCGEELARLTARWPMTRLLAVWNGLPGVTEVRRFTSRAAAVRRIWKAVQTMEPHEVAIQTQTDDGNKETASGGRKAQLMEMLKAESGATLPELMAATHWQAHSVRGFISGTLKKKMGLAVRSSKNGSGERVYRIVR